MSGSNSGLTGLADRYDLVIVGGGITGAGIFREAARAGISVLLLEARDYASGTSSWSSKLVHGGLRYLKDGHLRLTAESVNERQRLLRDAPDLVERLEFLMPLYRGVKPSAGTMRLGLWIYDRLSRVSASADRGAIGPGGSRFLRPPEVLALQPEIRSDGLAGAMLYHDARTDDCRLVWRLIAQGERDGGHARNYLPVQQLLSTKANGEQRVHGVAVHDAAAGVSREISAQVVINATGVWADALAGQPQGAPKLRPLRGSHLVFAHTSLPLSRAVSWLHPQDRRPIFAYPWQGATLLGTTDLDHADELWSPRMQPAEADYLLAGLQAVFPACRLTAPDAIACFAGVRPVVDGGSGDPSAVSRESALWSRPGLIGITGGKLTTFRVTARQVLKKAALQLPSLRLAAVDAPLFDATSRYSPGTAPTLADVIAGVGEHVRHLDDLLLRRTRAGLVLPNGGEVLIDAALQACRQQLAWDESRCEQERSRYQRLWQAQHDPSTL